MITGSCPIVGTLPNVDRRFAIPLQKQTVTVSLLLQTFCLQFPPKIPHTHITALTKKLISGDKTMNISKPTLSAIFGISLAALLSNSVLAHEKMVSKDQCRHSWGKKGGYATHFDSRMSALHTALQLTPAQETSWAEFLNKIKPVKMEEPAPQNWKNMSTPDRLDRRLSYVKAHEIKMTEHAAAVRTFYDTLTQDQKGIFDKQFQTYHHNS